MQCKKCGKEIKDGIKFCPACGEPTAAPTELKKDGKKTLKIILPSIAVVLVTAIVVGVCFALPEKPKKENTKTEATEISDKTNSREDENNIPNNIPTSENNLYLSKKTRIRDKGEAVEEVYYDKNGRVEKYVLQVEAVELSFNFEYGNDGRLSKVAAIENNQEMEIEVTYNEENGMYVGNAMSAKVIYDKNGMLRSYTFGMTFESYDEKGRIIESSFDSDFGISTPDSRYIYTYDENGRVAKVSSATNRERLFEYDDNGKLVKKTYSESNMWIDFKYDSDGKLIEKNECDPFGDGTYEISYVWKYEYDADGNLIKEICGPVDYPETVVTTYEWLEK